MYCSVNNDNFSGGRLATGHLLERGRRRIAFVGGPVNELEARGRYEGYAAALRENGLEVDPSLVRNGEWSYESGARQMKQLLEARPDRDGVFANSDLMAAGTINMLRELGRRVPADVAVVGYDDLSIARFNSPPLTTISQKIPQVGKLLAENLIRNIETGEITNVTLPAKLVIRKSSIFFRTLCNRLQKSSRKERRMKCPLQASFVPCGVNPPAPHWRRLHRRPAAYPSPSRHSASISACGISPWNGSSWTRPKKKTVKAASIFGKCFSRAGRWMPTAASKART
jgi:Periplasmic binding protein-like domain